MTVNLLELVQGHLCGAVLSNLGGLLGTNRKETAHAVTAAAPALIDGLMAYGSTEQGAAALDATLDKFDGDILENLGVMFGKEHGAMSSLGGDLLDGALGGSLSGVTDSLAEATRLGRGKIALLLRLLAPVVVGVLARERGQLVIQQGLQQDLQQGIDGGSEPTGPGGVAGLSALLAGQKGHLQGLLPTGAQPARGPLHRVASRLRSAARSSRKPVTGPSVDRISSGS